MSKLQYERSKSRQQALQILYQAEVCNLDPQEILARKRYVVDGQAAETLDELHGIPSTPPDEFACALVLGVYEHLAVIDEKIAAISQNWTLSRMPIVDRSILRIASYELLYDESIPPSVAINEAVELAKMFGGEESSKFVNGILGRAARGEEYSGVSRDDLPHEARQGECEAFDEDCADTRSEA